MKNYKEWYLKAEVLKQELNYWKVAATQNMLIYCKQYTKHVGETLMGTFAALSKTVTCTSLHIWESYFSETLWEKIFF